MLGLSGQLGEATLGEFDLGTMLQGQIFVPHRGAVNSALATPEADSALSAVKAASSLSSPGVRSAVTAPGARSTISAQNPRSEVSNG